MLSSAYTDEPVDISAAIFNICDSFGKQCQKTTCYELRGQANTNKVAQDHANGKIGEWCVYSVLKKQYLDILAPDMRIYQVDQKSWDSDLKDPVNNIRFAVKTQEVQQSLRFGMSWIFHKTDKEIFGSRLNNLYVCFVLLDRTSRTACICKIVKSSLLHEKHIFKPLKLNHLNATKQAVYYEDIKYL